MDIDSFLEKVYYLEEYGNIQDCEKLLLKVYDKGIFPNEEISKEIGLFYFRNGNYKNALLFLKNYLDIEKDEELIKNIIDAYYIPNKEKYNKIYLKNKKSLCNYKYSYTDKLKEYDNIRTLPLFVDNECVITFNKENQKIEILYNKCIENMEEEQLKKSTFLLKDFIFIEKIKFIENANIDKEDELYINFKRRLPLYLYFTPEIFEVFIQIDYIDIILKTGVIVLFVGLHNLRKIIDINTLIMYTDDLKILNNYDENDEFTATLREICIEKNQKIKFKLEAVSKYYNENKEKILNNIKSGRPKILFISNITTGVVHNHTINIKNAFETIGLETSFITENDEISIIGILDELERFKPDIVFRCNWFKYENNFYNEELKNLFFVTWIQDLFAVDKFIDNYKEIDNTNFILNHFIGWDKVKCLDYDNMMIDAPICSDNKVYKKYNLTQEEKNKYSADICIVSNGIDPYELVDIYKFPNNIKKTLYKYIEVSLNSDKLYFTNDDIKNVLSVDDPNMFEFMSIPLNYRIIKMNVANTILDAGGGVYLT